ncbi:DMT family transporter [Tateyamaria omphalii]|uniref:EamA domain-containing protein n=1 Tax=Tateyamaria omphalii TaxID=299262 RepID=A0A1P8MRU8_9RHOB|nr:DMT family transporter [Tateyamaria omphalii]APX10754.1 hypothetical protein BWR18_02865 [Tateyamaria omphalii]
MDRPTRRTEGSEVADGNTDNDTTSTRLVGIAWIILGVVVFTFFFASAKFVGTTDITLDIVFYRYVGGFMSICCVLALRRITPLQTTLRNVGLNLVRSTCGATGGSMMIAATAVLPVATATAIGLLDGVLIFLLGALLLKETPSRTTWSGLVLCLSGALCVVVIGQEGTFATASTQGLLLAVGGACFIAFEGVFIKVTGTRDRPIIALFYVNLFGCLLVFLALAIFGQLGALTDNILFIAWGPLAVFGQFCFFIGYRLAPLVIAGPVGYTWIIFSMLVGYLFFGEAVTMIAALGALLILLGGYLLSKGPA